MDHFSIREILDSVYRGQIRIPAFQRAFVWEPDRVAFLIDSIYKGYPFGSLLFWRTKEQLNTERQLGPFQLPEPMADFPIDYVLDGQQRITSIFGVFQTELSDSDGDGWKDIYFDYVIETDAQETQFFALDENLVDDSRHFPLRALFNTTEYRRLTKNMDDDLAQKIDDMQAVFKEVSIPCQTFKTEQKEKVAIIFERINRQGVPLDTLQLLSAWTWSEDFQLQVQFEELIEELSDYGFREDSDVSLLLRCTAAILTGSAKPESLVELNGSVVRDNFDKVLNGIKGALDFLKEELKVESIKNLPYSTLLVPLSVFFSVEGTKQFRYTDAQRVKLVKWFWRVAFSKRYSAGTMKNMNADITEITKLKDNEPNRLDEINVSLSADFFSKSKFISNTVNTKLFILILAHQGPKNIINGSSISLSDKLKNYNKHEFHHLMPKAYLRETKQCELYDENCLANFCFISRVDNNLIGGTKPSKYSQMMTGDKDQILASHLCPNALLDDDYEAFIVARSRLLLEKAKEFCVEA